MKKILLLVLSIGLFLSGYAQQDTIINPNSTERIPFYEQLYRFRVWRTIDLREKQNSGFKSARSDISDFLIKNIRNGSLIAYDGDSVKNPLSPTEVLVSNTAVDEPPYDSLKAYQGTETANYMGKNYASLRNDNIGHLPTDNQWWELTSSQTEFVTRDQLVALSLVEDLIFDKRRSRLYYDIQYIGLMVETNGIINPKGFIYYKEFFRLVEREAHSKNLDDRGKVQWRNRYNPSENKSFNEAFKLRLFHGIIEKVENPDDKTIQRIYEDNGRAYGESVFARWEEEIKLMEKEHNLWEY
jgi:gliding motility associated protien GldN